MGKQDSEDDSGGCFAVIAALVVAAWVLEHLVPIITILAVVIAVVALAGMVALHLERAKKRANCAVCSNWAPSVVLTDLDEARTSRLCDKHGARWRRIADLEQDVLGDG